MYFDNKPCRECGSEVGLAVRQGASPEGEREPDSTIDDRRCTNPQCVTNTTSGSDAPSLGGTRHAGDFISRPTRQVVLVSIDRATKLRGEGSTSSVLTRSLRRRLRRLGQAAHGLKETSGV